MKNAYLCLLLSVSTITVTYAQDVVVNQESLEIFFQAITDGNITEVKKILADGFDINQEYLGRCPLMEVLVSAPRTQKADLIEVLLQAGAQWPYTLADNLVSDDGLEFFRQETMTQYLKSQWMLRHTMSPEWSFYCKKMIPVIDELELKYKRKDTSDLLFFDSEDKDLSNVDICCKEVAYGELFSAIEQGSVDAVQATLALGVDPNYRNSRGISMLFHTFCRFQFYSFKKAEKIVGMLLNAGARWTPEEFEDISDPEIASTNPGSMTHWILQGVELFGELKKYNEQDLEQSELFGKYAKRAKKLAIFLDNYELTHQLKTQSEII